MNHLSTIKQRLPHDRKCRVWFDGQTNLYDESRGCNCTRRELIEYLERLERPSIAMTNAGMNFLERNGIEDNAPGLASLADLCFEKMLTAAEESQ